MSTGEIVHVPQPTCEQTQTDTGCDFDALLLEPNQSLAKAVVLELFMRRSTDQREVERYKEMSKGVYTATERMRVNACAGCIMNKLCHRNYLYIEPTIGRPRGDIVQEEL
jgi:hypothetical protein